MLWLLSFIYIGYTVVYRYNNTSEFNLPINVRILAMYEAQIDPSKGIPIIHFVPYFC